ncbi:unnamed protein product [Rotaria sordida]|uniref:RRM domain-containing protein n=1 Tax=Rotaria sordida TaxID=392033 RepID=A0A814RFE3_9BILA|nr:unnamed protein product [Rotaria sordida]CAF1132236.1 unnamed protein product [Rotaria sordida]CAF1190293.1 unnamed protein product [Rotaria sordida]CAF1354151.1 unnamed protein product [Rotaria sordida]CAF1358432.1 unnamed protein product [Rotaria sordida]
MSSISSNRHHYSPKYTEICIGNISNQTEPDRLLMYFEQFGNIVQYNFTSPTGGYVFITYKDPSMVDTCMKSRPHHLDGRHLYVKRALPIDDEHPRERFETTRDLMIVIDFDNKNCTEKEFLTQLRGYFSSYGTLYACKYCHETYFNYILVEFADKDQVDRIILDKPHYYNEHQLNVMKCIPSNIEIMNKKYSLNKQQSSIIIKDAIDDDNYDYIKSQNNFNKNDSIAKEHISEIDLENEVYRLQNVLKKMNDDFAIKRQQLEEQCSEQLKKLDANTDQTNRLQQDLEQEYAKLLTEYESIKRENESLNEQYLAAELENFEITSYYEQILSEEKGKTIQLENEYTQKLKILNSDHSALPSSPCLISSASSKSPSKSIISKDN